MQLLSLMCHIVPFQTSPSLCSHEGQAMEGNLGNVVLDQCGFNSFVPLKICLFKSLHNLKKAQKERPTEMMLYYT